MKKLPLTILCVALALFCASACGEGNGDFSSDSSPSSISESVVDSESSMDSGDSQSSSEMQAEQYEIFYQGVNSYDLSALEIPTAMMPSSRAYPDKYTIGERVLIDDLQYLITPSKEYEFLGYFSDAECTVAFTGVDEETTGNVTVYALIRVSHNTPNV